MKNNILGLNIKYLREKKGLEQQELAELLGLDSATTISKWETGKNNPRFNTLEKLAEVLGTSVHWLTWDYIYLHDHTEPELPKISAEEAFSRISNVDYPSLFTPDNAALAHRFLAENRINALGGLNTEAISDEEAITYANIIQKNMQDAEERSNTEIQLAMFQKFRDEKNK